MTPERGEFEVTDEMLLAFNAGYVGTAYAKVTAGIRAVAPLIRAEGWRCFNCNEWFTDKELAKSHFSTHPYDAPLCIADQRELDFCRRERDEYKAMVAVWQKKAAEGYRQGVEDAVKVADATAKLCEIKAKEHPEHTLKFARDCAVAQTIAVGIRALTNQPDASDKRTET